jgi:hypothetical protein
LLQLYATNMMLELAGRRGTTIGESGSADGFVAIARW